MLTNQYPASLYQFAWFIAALWTVEVVDTLFLADSLQIYGIQPGNWSHWEGIFLAPLLHGSWAHLMGNSLPLLIFGAVILIRGWKSLVAATLYSIIIGGFVVMLIGERNSVHIGASGVVYGYWAYIIAYGYYERTMLSISIAFATILLYGGYFYGMMPSQFNNINHISWEGHLGGALGGLAAAGRRVSGYSSVLV